MILVYCTLGALVVTTLLCVAASFTDRFEDNILQRVGLVVLGFASSLKAFMIAGDGYVEIVEAACYIGGSLLAIGTLLNPRHCQKGEIKCLIRSKPTHR